MLFLYLEIKLQMKHKEYNWKLADGTGIFAQSWQPKTKLKGVINFVHGFGEHSGRYAHWAERFCKHGFAFIAHDQKGYGKSEGKRGHIDSIDEYIEGVDVLLHSSKALFPNHKHVLYGHSMGGNVVINYCIQNKPELSGLIASSPWLKLATSYSWLMMAGVKLIHRIAPKASRNAGLDVNYISHDPEEKRKYKADPLNHEKLTYSMLREVMKAGNFALKNDDQVELPFLLQHGSGDKITSFKASQRLANSNKNIHFKKWPGLYHELHNEYEKEEIFEFLFEWISDVVD